MGAAMYEWDQINIGYSMPDVVDAGFRTFDDRRSMTVAVHDKLRTYFTDEFPYFCQHGGVIEVAEEGGHIGSEKMSDWLDTQIHNGTREEFTGQKMIVLRCERGAVALAITNPNQNNIPNPNPGISQAQKPNYRWCYPQGGKWYNREVFRLQEKVNDTWQDWNLPVQGILLPMIAVVSWECPFP
ncbi:MAG: hypothetical protein V3W41_08580 [Planctomycetota bacterium]